MRYQIVSEDIGLYQGYEKEPGSIGGTGGFPLSLTLTPTVPPTAATAGDLCAGAGGTTGRG